MPFETASRMRGRKKAHVRGGRICPVCHGSGYHQVLDKYGGPVVVHCDYALLDKRPGVERAHQQSVRP